MHKIFIRPQKTKPLTTQSPKPLLTSKHLIDYGLNAICFNLVNYKTTGPTKCKLTSFLTVLQMFKHDSYAYKQWYSYDQPY